MRELDADKKTLVRQQDALVVDFERIQKALSEVTQKKIRVEESCTTKDSEVTRLTYEVARLEQDLLCKEAVGYSLLCVYDNDVCVL